MVIELMHNNSENNVVNKSVSTLYSVDAVIKNETSIINPVLVFEFNNSMNNINYVYIPFFNRCYFISDIHVLLGNRYEITCKVDVLNSFKNDIKKLQCILENTETTGLSNYLQSGNWVASVKDKTDIINFENGLLDTGEFILITAGG